MHHIKELWNPFETKNEKKEKKSTGLELVLNEGKKTV